MNANFSEIDFELQRRADVITQLNGQFDEARATIQRQADELERLREALTILANRRAGAQIKAHPSNCMCSVHIAKRALSSAPAEQPEGKSK